MRRLAALALLAAVAAATAVVAGATDRSGAIDRAALLRQYEPVLLFHPQEDWAPERPEAFLSRARVERQIARGSWAGVPAPLPTSTTGCAFTPCYRLNLPCALRGGDACYERVAESTTNWERPVIYGRVVDVPSGTAPPAGFAEAPRYLVRYWLFYEFDDWRSARERLWQAHEGDWESISIGISAAGTPQFAAYSQHCSGTVRAWSGVTKRAGTHPVAYVALGSHANHFTNTSASTKFSECLRKYLDKPGVEKATRLVRLAQDRIVDRTGTAHPLGPDDVTGVTPLELVQLGRPLPVWARFPGRWSEGQLLWVGRSPRTLTTLSQGAGPATPNWNATSIPSLWHVQSS
jgi:hypothetical protein